MRRFVLVAWDDLPRFVSGLAQQEVIDVDPALDATEELAGVESDGSSGHQDEELARVR